MQVYLTALGCRLNEAELQTWAEEFRQASFSLTNDKLNADVLVFNSCAVTAEAARKSRQSIRKLHRENPGAKMVVTGCYVALEKEEAFAQLGADLVVGNQNKSELVEQIKELLAWQDMPQMATEPEAHSLFSRNKDRAFIKIQDGCRYRCTYCIVTVARGEEKSRSIAELVEEVNRIVRSGIQEVVLTGVHVGGYGVDLDTSLYDLVIALLEQTQVKRIRFASVEPWDLPKDFFELFKNPRVMPHMHLPIQSGCDSVLRRMARRCKTEEFKQLVEHARSIAPDFNVTTDVIVGFPGETEQEWQASMDYLQQIDFGHMHIFTYSNREGTKAARLPNQIDKETKKQRSRELHELARGLKQSFYQQFVGSTAEVLWESGFEQVASGLRFSGYIPNYLKVTLVAPINNNIAGQLMTVRLVSYDADNQWFIAELLDEQEQSVIRGTQRIV